MNPILEDRDDVLVSGRAPLRIRKFLLNLGGQNAYGEPKYRLVRAEKVMILLGGYWTDWPEETPIEEQGGLVFSEESVIRPVLAKIAKSGTILKSLVEMPEGMHVSNTRPIRRVREMRLMKRYPYHEGWMLQHWDPPTLYGSRQWWEAQRVPGAEDLQVLGPFPERGRYEQTVVWTTIEDNQIKLHSALLQQMPSYSKMEEAIQHHERSHEERFKSANWEWNRLIAVNERTQIEDMERKKYREYCTSIYRDKTKLLMGTSLAAGRLRSEAAKRAGITSHCGN